MKPGCDGKLRYASRREAAEAINHILHPKRWESRKVKKNRPKFLRSYGCGFCGGWHLTSREQVEDIARRHRPLPASPKKFNWRVAEHD